MAKGKTRRKKVPSGLRRVLAANVRARAKNQFEGSKNLPLDIHKHSSDTASERISLSHVKRILNGDREDAPESDKVSASLEQLDLLAVALDLLPYQLLMPGMDAKNPQVAKGAQLGEKEWYSLKDIKDAAKAAAQEVLEQTTSGGRRPGAKK